jgi:hypothetical protein
VDWPRILKRLKPWNRGLLLDVTLDSLALYESNFKYPILAIPHPDFQELNEHVDILSDIGAAVNNQLVHKFGGIKFVAPVSEHMQGLISKLIHEFDVYSIDIIDEYSDERSWQGLC